MNHFDSDLKFGKRGEKFILNIIQKKYKSAYIINKKFNYDIYIPEIKKSIECKTDRLSYDTGKVAIEFEYKNNPSGINNSKADIWALIFYSKELLSWVYGFIKIDVLKSICNIYGTITDGGENNNSSMYLIGTSVFLINDYITLNIIK